MTDNKVVDGDGKGEFRSTQEDCLDPLSSSLTPTQMCWFRLGGKVECVSNVFVPPLKATCLVMLDSTVFPRLTFKSMFVCL